MIAFAVSAARSSAPSTRDHRPVPINLRITLGHRLLAGWPWPGSTDTAWALRRTTGTCRVHDPRIVGATGPWPLTTAKTLRLGATAGLPRSRTRHQPAPARLGPHRNRTERAIYRRGDEQADPSQKLGHSTAALP
jgi:hypothetical protein